LSDQGEVRIETIVSRPFDENTFIIWRADRSDCLVVDPGFEPDLILELLERERLTPAAVLNTHGHADHIGGNSTMKERWPDVPLIIGAGDASKLSDSMANLSAPFGFAIFSPPADRLVKEGDQVEAAGFDLLVREIPGHSSGHVVFICHGVDPVIVLGGDVLFSGSIGRTDFPDGDQALLLSGIRAKLYDLPDSTIVLPGHGEPTTVGREKTTNPFVRA